MIRNGDCRHLELRSRFHERVVITGAVEQAEAGMEMEMDEVRHRNSDSDSIGLRNSDFGSPIVIPLIEFRHPKFEIRHPSIPTQSLPEVST